MANKTPFEQGLEDAREIALAAWLEDQRKHDETARRKANADLAEQYNLDRTLHDASYRGQ